MEALETTSNITGTEFFVKNSFIVLLVTAVAAAGLIAWHFMPGGPVHEQVNVITWINALVEGEPVDLQRLGFCLLGTTKDYIEVEHSHLYE